MSRVKTSAAQAQGVTYNITRRVQLFMDVGRVHPISPTGEETEVLPAQAQELPSKHIGIDWYNRRLVFSAHFHILLLDSGAFEESLPYQ